jgi:hypothetical protein
MVKSIARAPLSKAQEAGYYPPFKRIQQQVDSSGIDKMRPLLPNHLASILLRIRDFTTFVP